MKVIKKEVIGSPIKIGTLTNQGVIKFEKGFSGVFFSNGEETSHIDSLVEIDYLIKDDRGLLFDCSERLKKYLFNNNLEEIDENLLKFDFVDEEGNEVVPESYKMFNIIADLK
jgi:hypothetical protein